MKRVFDIIVSTTLLIALSPIMLLIAIGIKLDSSGSVFIGRKRAGQHGETFKHYRFRTMAGDPLEKTRFGRFIGNLSLDDIPTLWNVLCGDMSLIGPRPELVEVVDLADQDWQKVLLVKPGLSGPALLALRERYNQATVKERIQPDIEYAENSSFSYDIRLLCETLYWWIRNKGHIKGHF